MKAINPGDTVVVTRLDRLARSSRDLHNILHELQEQQCGFVSLAETWCDTTTDIGQLMLTIMGGIAQFERSLVFARTEAGIAKAREQGKRFGRPSALDGGQRRKIAERYAAGATMVDFNKAEGDGLSNGRTYCVAVEPVGDKIVEGNRQATVVLTAMVRQLNFKPI
jgi:DNA invertase Pin-like site-specific DNA recombinase